MRFSASLFSGLLSIALLALLALPTAFASPLTAEQHAQLTALSSTERRELASALLAAHALNKARSAAEGLDLIEPRSSPTGDYAPGNVPCPPTNEADGPGHIRDARDHTISANETDYINRHRMGQQTNWMNWLQNTAKLDIPGGVQNYTNTLDNLPRVGIALSGGGYRAMLYGSGFALGLDSRNDTANQRGTGGLLQMADYIAGLSGGSWAVGSLAINNWPTTQALNDEVWNLEENLVIPENGKVKFYASLVADVKQKRDLGYNTAITDYWGLALASHLLNSSATASTTFSDIVNTTNFMNAAYPFPVIIADEREPGELLISGNTSQWEFNALETGTWHPNISAFVPTKLIGSSFDNGASVLPDNRCVEGFDNFGWTVGTSSTLFNGLYNMLITSDGGLVADALKSIAGEVSQDHNDISSVPNPFFGYRNGSSNIATIRNVSLVDGGEDNENIPLWSLLQPARGLDFIFATDGSADISNWPNGSSLYQTSERAKNPQFSDVPFPDMPSTETFINRGLNTRPTFFGCSATTNVTNSGTAANNSKVPIVAYFPNYPYLDLANTSTFKLEYSAQESQGVIDNAVAVATLGGADSNWPTCLGCAIMQRSFERTGIQRPAECDSCMQRYCWDGVTNDTAPSNPYSPPIGTPSFLTSNGSIQASPAYTGGNGSNSQEGDASSQGTSAAAKDSALNVLAGARKTVGVAAAVAAVVVGLVVVV